MWTKSKQQTSIFKHIWICVGKALTTTSKIAAILLSGTSGEKGPILMACSSSYGASSPKTFHHRFRNHHRTRLNPLVLIYPPTLCKYTDNLQTQSQQKSENISRRSRPFSLFSAVRAEQTASCAVRTHTGSSLSGADRPPICCQSPCQPSESSNPRPTSGDPGPRPRPRP